MIQAVMTDGTLLFGIDAENVRRIKAGMPILIDLKKMGVKDGAQIIIMYGETLNDIVKDIEEATGQKLPNPSFDHRTEQG